MITPFDCFKDSSHVYRSVFEQHGLGYAIWGHIITLGGCPMAEHGVGRNPVKQTLLKELYGEPGIEQMRQVKSALDLDSRLAPEVFIKRRDPA